MRFDMKGVAPTRAALTGAVAGLVAALGVAAAMAADPIYKCVDASARVTYQSEPCRGGQRLDVAAGAADPASIARLERQVEADQVREFERRAAERAAADRLAERRMDTMAQALAVQATAGVPPADGGDTCVSCWGWNTFAPIEPPMSPKPPGLPKPPRPQPASSIVIPKASAPSRPLTPPPIVVPR